MNMIWLRFNGFMFLGSTLNALKNKINYGSTLATFGKHHAIRQVPSAFLILFNEATFVGTNFQHLDIFGDKLTCYPKFGEEKNPFARLLSEHGQVYSNVQQFLPKNKT